MTPRTRTERPAAGRPLLAVSELAVDIKRSDGPTVRVVDEFELSVAPAETVAIIGESGSGKTMAVRAIMGLLDPPVVSSGSVLLNGVDLLALRPRQVNALRGTRMSMIFQDALTSLHPSFTVGAQLSEILRTRGGQSRQAARRTAIELLDRVGIPAASRRYDSYPFQLSGGMRQRVLIAMAISLGPELLIADEPTTALDVTTQARILELIRNLQRESAMGVVFITHDLSVAEEIADSFVVMYAGRIVEQGTIADLRDGSAHPYTRGLMRSAPKVDDRTTRLTPIPGQPPVAGHVPAGCAFHTRCPAVVDVCRVTRPELLAVRGGHRSACHRREEVIVDG